MSACINAEVIVRWYSCSFKILYVEKRDFSYNETFRNAAMETSTVTTIIPYVMISSFIAFPMRSVFVYTGQCVKYYKGLYMLLTKIG